MGMTTPSRFDPGAAGSWDGVVVICAGTSWDGIWFPEKHVALRLSRRVPVLWVDPPLSRVGARRSPELAGSVRRPHLRLVQPGLARFTPVVPPAAHRPGMRVLTEWLTRRGVGRATRRLGGRAAALVMASPDVYFGAAREALPVLFATDDFVAGAELMGEDARWLRRQQARVAGIGPKVIAVSPAIAAKWTALGCETAMIPNGCDNALFETTDDVEPAPDVVLTPPIAGFVGHLSERIDMGYLEAVAATGASLLIVGPRQRTLEPTRMDELLAHPNVQWVGQKPFEDIPRYLAWVDVGITPYTDSAFNRASFPLKTLEYLAAGRAAVASDLPAHRWLDTDLVTIASSAEGFADAVQRGLRCVRTPALVARRREFAARHSWDERTVAISRFLGLPATAPGSAPSSPR